eukprot:2563565-Amphidinium_carterae.1
MQQYRGSGTTIHISSWAHAHAQKVTPTDMVRVMRFSSTPPRTCQEEALSLKTGLKQLSAKCVGPRKSERLT